MTILGFPAASRLLFWTGWGVQRSWHRALESLNWGQIPEVQSAVRRSSACGDGGVEHGNLGLVVRAFSGFLVGTLKSTLAIVRNIPCCLLFHCYIYWKPDFDAAVLFNSQLRCPSVAPKRRGLTIHNGCDKGCEY